MAGKDQLKFRLFERELIDPLRGHDLTETEKALADRLLEASSKVPIGITELIVWLAREGEREPNEREIKALIRSLRRDHHFPILSRKGKPAGYWWCEHQSEMEGWRRDFRSQALDELTTVSRIVRANYPALVGQLNLNGDEI